MERCGGVVVLVWWVERHGPAGAAVVLLLGCSPVGISRSWGWKPSYHLLLSNSTQYTVQELGYTVIEIRISAAAAGVACQPNYRYTG